MLCGGCLEILNNFIFKFSEWSLMRKWSMHLVLRQLMMHAAASAFTSPDRLLACPCLSQRSYCCHFSHHVGPGCGNALAPWTVSFWAGSALSVGVTPGQKDYDNIANRKHHTRSRKWLPKKGRKEESFFFLFFEWGNPHIHFAHAWQIM